MKLPNTTSKETATPVETAAATPPNSRKRPLSAANSQGVGPLRPPSRAPSAMGHWGPALCAPQIAIPDSRLHLTTSSRPRSRFNSRCSPPTLLLSLSPGLGPDGLPSPGGYFPHNGSGNNGSLQAASASSGHATSFGGPSSSCNSNNPSPVTL